MMPSEADGGPLRLSKGHRSLPGLVLSVGLLNKREREREGATYWREAQPPEGLLEFVEWPSWPQSSENHVGGVQP